MTRSEAWNLKLAVDKMPEAKGSLTDLTLIEDKNGNVVEAKFLIYIKDAAAGNTVCRTFSGRVPLTAEIVAALDTMREELVMRAKEQRRVARAIRADAK